MTVIGSRLFGKCDEIKGVGHVATEFFHINYMPLCPMASFFVLEPEGSTVLGQCPCCCCDGSDSARRVVKYPMSCKSILLAYFQAVAVWVSLFGWIFAICGTMDALDSNQQHHNQSTDVTGIFISWGIALGPLVVSHLLGRWARHTSFERAKNIAERMNSRQMLALVYLAYASEYRATPQSCDEEFGASESDDDIPIVSFALADLTTNFGEETRERDKNKSNVEIVEATLAAPEDEESVESGVLVEAKQVPFVV